MRSRCVAAFLCCVAVACSGPRAPDATSNGLSPPSDPEQAAPANATALVPKAAVAPIENTSEIPLEEDGGTFVVPVTINGAISLKFTIDSGASDVTIPSDVASTLVRAGTISSGDYIGSKTFVLADGSTIPSPEFRIRSLRVGGLVLHDVIASVTSADGSLLLGQTFLTRLKHWSIDNDRHVLVLTAGEGASTSLGESTREAVATPATQAAVDFTDQVPPETEAAARRAVAQFFEAWSDPRDPDGATMRPFYAASVNFYGKQMTADQLMQEKLKFARRWPTRSYTVEPNTLKTSCSVKASVCRVTGVLDWNAAGPGGLRRSSGTARFSLAYESGRIIEEHGRVLSRSGSND